MKALEPLHNKDIHGFEHTLVLLRFITYGVCKATCPFLLQIFIS